MTKLWIIPASIAFVCTSPLLAASPFDGTWKGDIPSAQLSKKPDVLLLQNGVYSCTTCAPMVKIPADGAFHAVAGSPYYDSLAVTVVDASTIKRVAKKGDKTSSETTMTVAPGGKSADFTFTDMTATNGVVTNGKGTETRVKAGPAGSHAISGEWLDTNSFEMSDAGLTNTFALNGDMLSFSTPTGIAYVAKVDGPIAPVTGDPGWTTVKVQRKGPRTLLETDYRDGKVIGTYNMTVDAGGKKMTIEANDLLRGRQSTYFAIKQ